MSHWATSLITSINGFLPPLDVNYQLLSLYLIIRHILLSVSLPRISALLSRFPADIFSMSQSVLPLCYFF